MAAAEGSSACAKLTGVPRTSATKNGKASFVVARDARAERERCLIRSSSMQAWPVHKTTVPNLPPVGQRIGKSIASFGQRPTTSGLPLETDIVRSGRHVSKVPKPEVAGLIQSPHRLARGASAKLSCREILL